MKKIIFAVIILLITVGGITMYQKIGWENSPSIKTPVSAENLEHMDEGIYQAHSQLAEKANQGDTILVSQIDKNQGKLDESYMTEGFLQQMAGTTPIGATPPDESITPIKTTFLNVSPNLFNKLTVVEGRLVGTDGTITENTSYYASDYTDVAPFITYTFTRGYSYSFYDANKVFISGGNLVGNAGATVTSPEGAKYIRFEMHKVNAPINTFMFVKGTTLPTAYQPFGEFYLPYRNLESPTGLNADNFASVFLLNNDLTNGTDLNTLSKEGNFTGHANGNYINLPSDFNINLSFLIENKAMFKGGNRWFIQTLTENGDNYKTWTRRLDATGTGTQNWVSTDNKPTLELTGKKVVNLGDSLFGNTRGTNSISQSIADRTGATTYNIGFGGSRIGEHMVYWDAFSLYRLADEIAKDDSDPTKWALQDDAISAGSDSTWPDMPGYYSIHLESLKGIDFSAVNFITIAGGTNDYTGGVEIDNETDKYDITTFAGSYRYSLEKIMTAYPHLKILLCTPVYRFWIDGNGDFVEDSDTKLYNGKTLIDFVEKTIEIAKEYKTPSVDNYFELGINKFNRIEYFTGVDTTHPNAVGNGKIGHKIGSVLISKF